MKFSQGTTILANSEPFGELVDVVVDPFDHGVTHIVVQPSGDHQQTRLVPMWLVSEDERGLRVALPDTHVRQLQRCLESDYMRVQASSVSGSELSGFRSALALPYFRDEAITGGSDATGLLPRSECEIRRSSWVVGHAGRVLGTVAGFILVEDMIHSIIVRSGVIGHRHHVAVPIGNVSSVSSHFLTLDLDRDQFKKQPLTKVMRFSSHYVRPKELWREVLGHPTNRLWDSFDLTPPPEVEADDEPAT